MKNICIFSFLLLISTISIGQTTPFDNLNANYGVNKSILWYSSNYGSGFGHRIINSDPGGKTLLNFQGRHNSGSWGSVLTLTSNGFTGVGGVTDPKAQLVIGNNFGASISGSAGGHAVFGTNFAVQNGGSNHNKLFTPYTHTNNYGYAGIRTSWSKIYFYAEKQNTTANQVVNPTPKMTINELGNVGIGTTAPMAKLHVNSNADVGRGQNPAFLVGNRSGLHIAIDDNEIGAFSNNGNSTLYLNGSQSTSNTIINGDGPGNVGIGTVNPKEWRLAVNGKIRAKEIKVETGWADYVFEDSYDLPTLQQVEQYITEKGHLINIPSAAEVAKDGIFLGEMNAKLLEKIEELTLYTIAQEKKIDQQIIINKELSERLAKLEALLNKE